VLFELFQQTIKNTQGHVYKFNNKKKKLLGEILTIIKSLSFIKFKPYYYES